jgi:hypothetical protein
VTSPDLDALRAALAAADALPGGALADPSDARQVIDGLAAACRWTADRIAALEAERDLPPPWSDRDDEWSEAVKAAHPVRSESHATYATAMQMVGARHSKGALVALVNWLLMGRDAATRRAAAAERVVEAARQLTEARIKRGRDAAAENALFDALAALDATVAKDPA